MTTKQKAAFLLSIKEILTMFLFPSVRRWQARRHQPVPSGLPAVRVQTSPVGASHWLPPAPEEHHDSAQKQTQVWREMGRKEKQNPCVGLKKKKKKMQKICTNWSLAVDFCTYTMHFDWTALLLRGSRFCHQAFTFAKGVEAPRPPGLIMRAPLPICAPSPLITAWCLL